MAGERKKSENTSGMHPSRVVSLSDGVFAIAMTILILNLNIPDSTPHDTQSLLDAFSGMTSNLMNFALAFLLLGTFWISHYRKYHVIRRTDDTMIWLNILTLMFVALIPFSTSAYDDYTDLWPAALFFEGNILVVGLLQYAQWEYAIRGLRLVDDDYEERNIYLLRYLNLATPAVALLAMVIALLISPAWSAAVFISIPFIIVMLRRKFGGEAED